MYPFRRVSRLWFSGRQRAGLNERKRKMTTNVGTVDRVIRLVVAVLAVIGALSIGGGLGIVLWIVAALMAVTAAVGFCPPYRLLGINTCGVRR